MVSPAQRAAHWNRAEAGLYPPHWTNLGRGHAFKNPRGPSQPASSSHETARSPVPCLRIEANGQDLLTGRDVVTDRQIRLAWNWDVIEPGKLFFRCGSMVAAAHSLKAGKNVCQRQHSK
jgi:hypothetical protein